MRDGRKDFFCERFGIVKEVVGGGGVEGGTAVGNAVIKVVLLVYTGRQGRGRGARKR